MLRHLRGMIAGDASSRRPYRFWRLLLLFVWLSGCTQPQAAAPTTLKIALIAPFTGDYEPLGRSIRDGVALAVEEWNLRGGVLNRRIEVTLHEGGCSYKTAKETALAAIAEEQASFIIGEVCALASEGVAQAAMERGVLQISPATTDLAMTLDDEGQTRPLIFRVPFTDAMQGRAMAKFALEVLHVRRAALVLAADSEYVQTLSVAFEQAFTEGGGEIVARTVYDTGDQTYFEELEDVRAAEPEVIYLPGYYEPVSRMMAQARAFGVNATFLGSDGWDSPALNFVAAQGAYYPTHYFPDVTRPEIQGWQQKYQARYIVSPDALATMAYDATDLLLTAITQAQSFDPAVVAQTLETGKFNLITGLLQYDEQHNPIKPVIILQVYGDRAIYATSVTP